MTRAEAIEIIENTIQIDLGFCGEEDVLKMEEALHMAVDALREQEERRWIPVADGLPNEEELVLIRCKNGARFVGYCGKQYCDNERRWMIKTALNSTKLLNKGRVAYWAKLQN